MKGQFEMDFFKVSSSPHMKHEDTTASIMSDVLIALLPALVFGVMNFGFRALTLTLVSVVSCVLFEYLYRKLMKKTVRQDMRISMVPIMA